MPTNMIAGETVEVLPGGGTLTTLHLTDEAKRGLVVDADKFKQACDESVAYYANRGRTRRSIVLSAWLNLFSMLAAAFLIVVFIAQDSFVLAAIWGFVCLMDLLGIFSQRRRLREYDRSDV